MIDIRQSPQFADFMQDIGWNTEKINSTYIYLRRFPFVGYFAKIPRPKLPIDFSVISHLVRKKRIFQLKIAPMIMNNDKNYRGYQNQLLSDNWKIDESPFNPTTTIHIDLGQNEKQLFNSFTEAKRRGVRRAIKNGVVVKESSNIEDFMRIRQRQYFPLGFLVTGEMQALWKNFYPDNASLLLTYPSSPTPSTHTSNPSTMLKKTSPQIPAVAKIYGVKPLAGILLLFYDKVAYYWYASSLKAGKKLFAPTLLVWEALKLAKKRGCKLFDFEGIYDDRFPKASKSWRGFTKFKEGFGGKKIVFLENFTR